MDPNIENDDVRYQFFWNSECIELVKSAKEVRENKSDDFETCYALSSILSNIKSPHWWGEAERGDFFDFSQMS